MSAGRWAAALAVTSLAAVQAVCGGGSSPTAPPSPSPPAGGGFDYSGVTHVSWWHDEYGTLVRSSISRRAPRRHGGGLEPAS